MKRRVAPLVIFDRIETGFKSELKKYERVSVIRKKPKITDTMTLLIREGRNERIEMRINRIRIVGTKSSLVSRRYRNTIVGYSFSFYVKFKSKPEHNELEGDVETLVKDTIELIRKLGYKVNKSSSQEYWDDRLEEDK